MATELFFDNHYNNHCKAELLFTQSFFQLRPESSPAPADFFGLDFAGCDALQIGRAGYFKIFAGLLGGQNVILAISIFHYSRMTITVEPAVGTATSVEFFAPVFTAATLFVAIACHKYFPHFLPCLKKFGYILIKRWSVKKKSKAHSKTARLH